MAPGYQHEFFLTLPFPACALEFDTQGNLYTNDSLEFGTGLVNILKISKDGNYDLPYEIYASYGTDMRGVNGLDFDPAGSLFVSEFEHPCCDPVTDDGDSGLIRKIDKHIRISDPLVFSEFRPTGIAAIGRDALVFPARKWSDLNFSELYAVDDFDKQEVSFLQTPPWPLTAIAVDHRGNLFVGLPCGDPPCWVLGLNPYTDEWMGIATFNKYVEELNFDAEGNLYALEDCEIKEDKDNADIIKLILPHVMVLDCDTDIVEWPFEDGSTITDIVEECAVDAENHGAFVKCVANLTNNLKKEGIITGEEKGAIVSCAAQADIY